MWINNNFFPKKKSKLIIKKQIKKQEEKVRGDNSKMSSCKYCKSENLTEYKQLHSEFPDRTYIKCNDCKMSYEKE
jgi:hypothetical protein